MITGGVTEKVPIPHELGHWFDLRVLSWLDFKAAADVRASAALARMREMGAEVIREVQAAGLAGKTEPAAEPNPLDTYDQRELLIRGIAAWSYDDEVTPETIDRLDEETATWAATTIATLRKRTDDERLNASSRSIGS